MRHVAFWNMLAFLPFLYTHALFTVNPQGLGHIQQLIPLDTTFHVQDPLFTSNYNLSIHLPNAHLFTDPTLLSFDDRSTSYLKQNLPDTLKQFGIPDAQIQAKVDRGVPLMLDMVKQLLEEQKGGDKLQPRSFLGGVLDWAGDFGCGLVAAAGFPLYAIAAADFTAANGDPVETSAEQDFFITPSHGTLAHSAPVKIYYQAGQLPLSNADGITFNRNVFIKRLNTPNFDVNNYADFAPLIKLLIHEFTHVEQYRALGYDLVSFGHAYMFQYCKAGFSYNDIEYEVAARARQNDVDELLLLGNRGNDYFWIWKYSNLQPQLGSPTSATLDTPPQNEAGSELRFEKGVMQILDPNHTDKPQYRIFTWDEITKRSAAQCNDFNPICGKVKARDLSPRSPMQKDGPVTPSGGKCYGDAKKEAIAQCKAAEAEWSAIRNSRPWRQDVTIPQRPQPPPPPPPPKPGCPPDCTLITIVPATSKSCQFDEPPPGCDSDAKERNKDCRAKLSHCGL